MHVGHRAQRYRVLQPCGAGQMPAAGQPRIERGRGCGNSVGPAQGHQHRVKRDRIAAQCLKAQRRNRIGSIDRAPRARQRDRAKPGGTGRAVDQAQPFLGLKHQRGKARARQRLGPGQAFIPDPRMAFADQHQRNVCHVRQIADRSTLRHFGHDAVIEQGQQCLDHRHAHPRTTVGMVVGLCGHDRAHFGFGQGGAHAAGMAHDQLPRKATL